MSAGSALPKSKTRSTHTSATHHDTPMTAHSPPDLHPMRLAPLLPGGAGAGADTFGRYGSLHRRIQFEQLHSSTTRTLAPAAHRYVLWWSLALGQHGVA